MQGEKLDKLFYFRTVSDEDHDDNIVDSIMLPVDKITGIRPVSRTQLRIYFEQPLSGFTSAYGSHELVRGVNGNVQLQVNEDTHKEVIKAIIDASNAAPSDGIIVIADDTTTDADGSVRPPRYIHKDIKNVNSNIVADR